MTPVFKNHAVITKELYTELVKKNYRFSRRNIVGLIFGLGFLAFAVLYGLWGDFLLAAIMGVGALALLWLWRFGYQLAAAKGYKRRLERSKNCPPERITSFFEDHIEVEAADAATSVWKYPQISRVVQGKGGIALMLRDNIAILLDANAFEGGARSDFIAFLLKKCPDAKW